MYVRANIYSKFTFSDLGMSHNQTQGYLYWVAFNSCGTRMLPMKRARIWLYLHVDASFAPSVCKCASIYSEEMRYL